MGFVLPAKSLVYNFLGPVSKACDFSSCGTERFERPGSCSMKAFFFFFNFEAFQKGFSKLRDVFYA